MRTPGPNSASAGNVPSSRDAFGAERKGVKRAAVVLATSAFSGVFVNPTRARFRVSIPSARLRVKVSVAYFTDSGVQPTYGGSEPVIESLIPFVLDERGKEALLDATIDGGTEELPMSFDFDTAADGFYGVVSFSAAAVEDLAAAPGEYKAVVTWEPTADMDPREWEAVQQECIVTALQRRAFGIGGGA